MAYLPTVVLESLIATLNELAARLTALANVRQTANESLRTTTLTGSVVSASIAAAQTLSALTTLINFGTGYPAYVIAVAQTNLLVAESNIKNVVSP